MFLYNVRGNQVLAVRRPNVVLHCLLTLLLPWHFSTLFIAIFITEEATGDGWEELSTKGSWGHHSPSDRSTSDICLQFMWHIPHRPRSEQICQRVWRIIEIAGGTLTLIPLIPLSPPLPDVWHPVIFLWPFHTATTTLPLCPLLNVQCLPLVRVSQALYPHLFCSYTTHSLRMTRVLPTCLTISDPLLHCCVADSRDHLPESVHAVVTHTVLFLVCCVSSARYKDISSNHLGPIVSNRY